MSDLLPRRVRVGYGLGSVATGTFGTVPGLMLLPYLTDTLGVAAAIAGLIVLLPKAWDVVLNPIAGRISDRTDDVRGPRRPFLLRAGLLLAVCFALLHVPLYGWHVVPLDLAVGLVLGGLRHGTGTAAAPAVTHVGADLVGWFLT